MISAGVGGRGSDARLNTTKRDLCYRLRPCFCPRRGHGGVRVALTTAAWEGIDSLVRTHGSSVPREGRSWLQVRRRFAH